MSSSSRKLEKGSSGDVKLSIGTAAMESNQIDNDDIDRLVQAITAALGFTNLQQSRLSDAEQAFQIQLQEALYASYSSSTPSLLPPSSSSSSSSSSSHASSSSSNSRSSSVPLCRYHKSIWKMNIKPKRPCIVCLEPPPANGIFEALPCSHRLCIPCLIRYVASKLQVKQIPIPCVEPRCRETLTLEVCKPFLPSPLSDEWETLLAEHQIPQGERVYCPFPDCSTLLIKDINGNSIDTSAECPSCNRLFCVSCLVPWHAHLTCSEYQKLPPDERSREDLLLQGLAKEQKWSRCSNCKHFIELRQGCNHMTCRCGNEFCYNCGAKWTSQSHTCKKKSRE